MNWLNRFIDWLGDDADPAYTEPNTCYVYAIRKCCCGEKRILLGDLNTLSYHYQRRQALRDNGWESDSGTKLCTTCLTDRTITREYEEDERT